MIPPGSAVMIRGLRFSHSSGIRAFRGRPVSEQQLVPDKVIVLRVKILFCHQKDIPVSRPVREDIEKGLHLAVMIHNGLRVIVDRPEINLKALDEFIVIPMQPEVSVVPHIPAELHLEGEEFRSVFV